MVASFDSLVAPFDLAILFLVLALAGMVATWTENKGDAAPAAGGMLVHEACLKREWKLGHKSFCTGARE